MNFNSAAFLVFLPLVVCLYWLLPFRARKYALLMASWFFYMYWNPLLILLLLASTGIDYLCGLGMDRFDGNPGKRKLLLCVSVCMNLGILFFFKYWDFFGECVSGLMAFCGIPYRVPSLNLILPVGISFYTFQALSYSIDVYRRKCTPEKDFVYFALFVSYFPQLVAGPIERPGDLLPQLKKEHRWRSEDLKAGVRLLLCGFFRKCVVADTCGIYVNRVFDRLLQANALAVAGAGALFCIQMYCDFAGYSEIAAGSARLMGVRLTRNFDRPYLSQSYGEFFRRWHISLNRWFTQYLYIPLGGSRRGLLIRLRNTVIVFALCGLWHGARWTYVLWGLYAAFFVCLESVLEKPAGKITERLNIPLNNPLVVFTRRLYMLLIFIPAALLFRAGSVQEVGQIIQSLLAADFSLTNALGSLGMTSFSIVSLTLTLCAMARIYDFGLYDLPDNGNGTEEAGRQVSGVLMVLVIALCWLALLATEDAAGFAYFQF